MRQETGSNNPRLTKDKVSIQLKLSGHRFSIEGEAAIDSPTQTVCVIGIRATLVPEESLESFTAEALMDMAGYRICENETVVRSDSTNGVVCLMAIPNEAMEKVKTRCPGNVTYSSPLQDMIHEEQNCMTIRMYGNVMFIHAFNRGLHRAEAFEIESDADIIYIASNLMDGAGLGADCDVFYSGEKKTFKLLRRYFANVRCE